MPRLIAAAAAALIITAPAHALDLSGGTLRGATAPDAVAWEELAEIDVAPAPTAEDQLDALVAEDAALGIEASASVPLGTGGEDVAADGAMDGSFMEWDDATGDEAGRDEPVDLAAYEPRERFVESIPVLAAPKTGFQVVLPRSSASVAVLPSSGWGGNEWGANNPRPSTVVMGGSWVSR